MKSLTITAVALGFALKVKGQVFPPDFTSMPSCAFTPLTDAVTASGCAQTDVACFCGTSAFVNTIASEVSAGCSSTDRTEAYRIITDLCSLNGVPINLGGSGGGASTTTTAAITTTTTTTTAVLPPPPTSTTTTTSPATTGAPSSTTSPGGGGPSTTGITTTGITTLPSQATSTGSASPPLTYTGGGPHVGPGWKFKGWQGGSRGGSCRN